MKSSTLILIAILLVMAFTPSIASHSRKLKPKARRQTAQTMLQYEIDNAMHRVKAAEQDVKNYGYFASSEGAERAADALFSEPKLNRKQFNTAVRNIADFSLGQTLFLPFEEFDLNKDGVLTREEFVPHLTDLMKELQEMVKNTVEAERKYLEDLERQNSDQASVSKSS